MEKTRQNTQQTGILTQGLLILVKCCTYTDTDEIQ